MMKLWRGVTSMSSAVAGLHNFKTRRRHGRVSHTIIINIIIIIIVIITITIIVINESSKSYHIFSSPCSHVRCQTSNLSKYFTKPAYFEHFCIISGNNWSWGLFWNWWFWWLSICDTFSSGTKKRQSLMARELLGALTYIEPSTTLCKSAPPTPT